MSYNVRFLFHPLGQPRQLMALIALVALALIVGAFVLEHGFNAAPCRMCWWQRYGHWVLAVLACAGVVAAQLGARLRVLTAAFAGVLLAALASGGIGAWQAAGQLGWVELPAVCQGAAAHLAAQGDLLASLQAFVAPPRCDARGFEILGLTLAMWNVLAMAGVAALAILGLARTVTRST